MRKKELQHKIINLEDEIKQIKYQIKLYPDFDIYARINHIPINDIVRKILRHLNLEIIREREKIELKKNPPPRMKRGTREID